MKKILLGLLIFILSLIHVSAQNKHFVVHDKVMESVYLKIKTPYKFGLVIVPDGDSKKADCLTVFKKNNQWYMSYIMFDGRGYETWIAKSTDLLHWSALGKILSFSRTSDWDCNQKAGYISLLDYHWGGSYAPQTYKGNYWLSYLGGRVSGYEEGKLKVGVAFTAEGITLPHEWKRLDKPVLTPADSDARWWEHATIYKSSIIWDKAKHTGHPFVMYYNAKSDTVERIGMAVSDDMEHWKRYLTNPMLDNQKGITGDAVIQKTDSVYVMFYFGAFWKDRNGAFNRFACSYDLIHWTDWKGEDLIKSSESYDDLYAHKSCVAKNKNVVYHFYCAVNEKGQRGIAVATSKDVGKSSLLFITN